MWIHRSACPPSLVEMVTNRRTKRQTEILSPWWRRQNEDLLWTKRNRFQMRKRFGEQSNTGCSSSGPTGGEILNFRGSLPANVSLQGQHIYSHLALHLSAVMAQLKKYWCKHSDVNEQCGKYLKLSGQPQWVCKGFGSLPENCAEQQIPAPTVRTNNSPSNSGHKFWRASVN